MAKKYRSYANRIEHNTRSAANAGWASAGVGAVGALQAARGARAAEELAALARVDSQRAADSAEQTRLFQFSTWRQSPEGVAFTAWRDPAFRLAQFLRNRDSAWEQAWTQVISRAQAEVPAAEVQRVRDQPARVRQTPLKVLSILSLVLATFFVLGALLQMAFAAIPHTTAESHGFTYAECLTTLADPSNFLISEANCEAIKPEGNAPIIGQAVPAAMFLGLGITLAVVRKRKRGAALTDPTLTVEAGARIERHGFDPLAVAPGYTPFAWRQSPDAVGYADLLMRTALYDGHGQPPTAVNLIEVRVPAAHPAHDAHPADVNELLARFAVERPELS